MENLLAFDAGTSGTKAVLLSLDGYVQASAFEPYPTRYPAPLLAEQDPEDWWEAICTTTRRLLEQTLTKPEQVLGLAFSTQMVNAIPVSKEGSPLRPCISWMDGRAGAEASRVMRILGGPAIFAALVGVGLTGKDLLPKYLWIKRHEPEIYARAAAIVDASSYLLQRATGRLVYEWSTASVTGMFNLKTKTWDSTMIRVFGLDRAKFPELVRSSDCVGGLTRTAAAELGLFAGTPVFGGAGDAMASSVGAGTLLEGEAHLCLGTSGYVTVLTGRRVVGKHGLVTIQSADPAKLMLIGESETVGACLKWAASQLYDPDGGAEDLSGILAQMDAEVAETDAGAGGLLFTPWMYGERSPIADERLRAAFLNLGVDHSRAQMVRAMYEGVGYNLAWILASIAQLYGFKADPLRVTGGGARGLPWLQIIADITRRRLETAPHLREAAAVGAGLVAAVGLGIYQSLEAIKPLVPVSQVIVPDDSNRAVYDRQYAAYRQVYPALKKLYHQMNEG